MRTVWIVAACLLVAGCATQQPASPDGGDATDGTEETQDATDGNETTGSQGETGDEGGDDQATDGNDTRQEDVPMQVTSPAFDENETIPREHTGEGADTSPPLNVSGVPSEAQTLAIIVDDPDAPREEPWVHWLIWNVPASADVIPEGYPPSGDGKAFDPARQGTNSFSEDNQRYRGPYPPEGHGPHRYRFTLFALDTSLELEPGANRTQLEDAIDGHVVERDRLTGTYER